MSSDLQIFYDERKDEVEQYFNFLEALDIGKDSQLQILLNQGSESENKFNLSNDHVKIFKGNCFLMLYNLIEGTVNKSLEFVFDAINENEVRYSALAKSIKAIWLKSEIKESMKNDMKELSVFIDAVSEQVFSFNLEKFAKNNRSFFSSGNLDSKSIRDDLAPRIGLNFGEAETMLRDIKDWRNKLAHGEQSFAEIAQDKTYSDILPYKKSAFEYLEKYLSAIEEYVNNASYKESTPTGRGIEITP